MTAKKIRLLLLLRHFTLHHQGVLKFFQYPYKQLLLGETAVPIK